MSTPIQILSSCRVEAYEIAPTAASLTGFEARLRAMSGHLKISPNPADYFMHVVPILISDLPNRNGMALPFKELVAWNPTLKMLAYEGWRYAPMFVEHKSDDLTKAIGVVADVSMRPIKGFGNGKYWKVLALAALDRTKDPILTGKVERGEVNTYSMGCMAEELRCSYCGAVSGKCNHLDEGPVTFYELNGEIVHQTGHGLSPYELSVVLDPAFAIAHSDVFMSYSGVKVPTLQRERLALPRGAQPQEEVDAERNAILKYLQEGW